eukprot:gene2138-2457_t
MATGDIRGNICALERCLKHLKYPSAVDEVGLMLGDPLAVLPILNFALLKYSRHVAAFIMEKGIQLQGKTDERFVRGALQLFRDHLGIKVVLSPSQVLEQGYAERKVLLLMEAVKAVRQLHLAAAKLQRARAAATHRQTHSAGSHDSYQRQQDEAAVLQKSVRACLWPASSSLPAAVGKGGHALNAAVQPDMAVDKSSSAQAAGTSLSCSSAAPQRAAAEESVVRTNPTLPSPQQGRQQQQHLQLLALQDVQELQRRLAHVEQILHDKQ